MSKPELNLWHALRRGGLNDLKFRRQHPVGPYVLDFYCASLRLAVEVDGYDHCLGSRPRRDATRDQWLVAIGIRTLRIPARDVLASVDDTLSTMREHIAHLPPPDAAHPPPPEGEEGLRCHSSGPSGHLPR
ncbi:endonuclease domain-containing protein [Caulobacter sp.]|uniref:endonuclease domain-containing protein n=1 Tax=Caulobacter sp. TaxID=78 RepID=UPI0025BEA96E|nr:endonuclease domain-containing protein [Caulobacter sp.]